VTGQPQGLTCPLCGQPPALVILGQQLALCGNENCKTLMWDATSTLEELMTNINFITPLDQW
jgi:hypothetical protein